MEIFRIIGIGLIVTSLSVLIRQYRPEIAIALPILGVATILFCVAPYLKSTLYMFTDIADKAGVESRYLTVIIKMIGTAYLCQFSAELCRDAGEGSVAGKIEFAGKLMILSLSMPIVYELLELVDKIINF